MKQLVKNIIVYTLMLLVIPLVVERFLVGSFVISYILCFFGYLISRREFCYLVYSVLFLLSHLRRGEDAFEVNTCRKPFLYALLLDTFCKQLYYIFC